MDSLFTEVNSLEIIPHSREHFPGTFIKHTEKYIYLYLCIITFIVYKKVTKFDEIQVFWGLKTYLNSLFIKMHAWNGEVYNGTLFSVVSSHLMTRDCT